MNIQVTVDPNRNLADFQQAISNHFAVLRNTIRALEDGSFAQNAISRTGAIVQMEVKHNPEATELAVAACNRCFLDLVRELITYLDRMIALKRFTGKLVKLPSGRWSQAEVVRFIEGKLSEAYDKIARDTALTNPKKLDEFPSLPEVPKKAALSYFTLRRVLEHRGGKPSTETIIHVNKVTLLIGGGAVEKLPHTVGEAGNLGIRIAQIDIKFLAGRPVALTEQDVEALFFTLQAIIGPAVRDALL